MRRTENGMFGKNLFKLGIFSPNCSGGMAITTVPERWDASWSNNVKLAAVLDDAGIEFILPIARWVGYGGSTDFQGSSLETVTWATGILAKTKALTVFATAHTAFFHPLVAAKQFATIGEIAEGRFGLNVVCGWNQPEYEMFGLKLSDSHDERYALGSSWLNVMKRAWSKDGAFDWKDSFFNIKNGQCSPKPFLNNLPPIMNAGSSTQGQSFAAQNCDFLFTVMLDIPSGSETVKHIQAISKREYQRTIDVFTTTYVVCRPTMSESLEYHHHYAVDHADWPAVDKLMELMGMHAHSFPRDQIASLRTHFAGGHGVYPLIGDPDTVADEIERIAMAGFGGISMSFVNYVKELPFFIQEVIPRLENKGLRIPTRTQI